MIGRAAVPVLAAEGHEVIAVVRSEQDADRLTTAGAVPWQVDLFDRGSVDAAMDGVNAVVHHATSIPPLAAMGHRGAWAANDRLRSEATSILVDAAIANEVARFVQQSITFVYPDGGDEWLDETTPVVVSRDSHRSVLDAEAQVERFRQYGGFGVTLRLSSLYGPGSASAELLASVSEHRLTMAGDGRNFVSSVHSHDAATATLAALTAPGDVYNVSDDEPLRAIDYVQSLAEVLGVSWPRRVAPGPAGIAIDDITSLPTVSQRISNSRFKAATGWNPRFPSVTDGWRHVVAENRADRDTGHLRDDGDGDRDWN